MASNGSDGCEQHEALIAEKSWIMLDDEARDIFRELHRHVWQETASENAHTLRSILRVLAQSGGEQLVDLVHLYQSSVAASPVRAESLSSPENTTRETCPRHALPSPAAAVVPGAHISAASCLAAPCPCQAGEEASCPEAAPEAISSVGPAELQPVAAGFSGDTRRLELLAQVRLRSTAMRDAPHWIREDREFALAAAQANGHALAYVSEALRRDQDVVLAAVSQQGNALRFAAYDRRKDRVCVLAAVRNDGHALGFAPEEMRNDAEVALAAIENNSHALKEVGPELWRNRGFALSAVARRGNAALRFLPPELRSDPRVKYVAKHGLRLRGAPSPSEQSRN